MSISSDFERDLLADIPLARAMQLSVHEYRADELVLAAPLAPNVNDKGCAFGGSLGSLLTLAGWGLIVLHLREAGRDCDVYVQDSQMRYLAPVWTDFHAQARLAEGEGWQAFDQALAARGRARARLQCRVPLADGSDACTLEARFVAMAKRESVAAPR
jgi:thioesterase domain-containing protein